MYEADDKQSYASIAKFLGISKTRVCEVAKKQGWKKANSDAIVKAAIARANYRELPNVTQAVALEKAVGFAVEDDAGVHPVQTLEVSIEIKSKVLEKHRKETDAVRQLAYIALKEKDYEKARIARITMATLKDAQACDRVSYGLNTDEGNQEIVIVRE